MDISIIIVSYNTADLLTPCIESILKQTGVSFEIIVIDNNSPDNSLAVLENFKDKINIIASPENLGFGKANNKAFQQSQGRYLFILNPDTELQAINDLQTLVKFMDQNPNYGLIGTRIINSNQSETLPQNEYPGERYVTSPFSALPGDIAWVLGASMITHREIFSKINGFDEDYFLYGEDTDLCLRIRQLGYQIGYLKEVTIKHIGRASERKTAPFDLWRKKRNGLYLFIKKHYDNKQAKQIINYDLRRSQQRLFLLKLKQLVWKLSPTEFAKHEKYRATSQTAKAFLERL